MSELPDLSAPSPADGPTTPGRPAVRRPDAPVDRPTERILPRVEARTTGPGRPWGSGSWIGVILGAVVLVLLLVLIVGNPTDATVSFLGAHATLPLGIWLLLAAVAGILLVAIPGLGWMLPRRRYPGGHGRMVE